MKKNTKITLLIITLATTAYLINYCLEKEKIHNPNVTIKNPFEKDNSSNKENHHLDHLAKDIEKNNDLTCDNLDLLQERLETLNKNLQRAESLLYKSLETSKISIERKNAIYHAAGFEVNSFRIKQSGYTPNTLANYAFDDQLKPVVSPVSYQLTLALGKQDYAEIINLFSNGQLTQNSTIDGWSILSTLMMHTSIEPNLLKKILNTGINVNFADLVFATLTKQNEAILDSLAQEYTGDINIEWLSNGRYYNLITLSAESINYAALKIWSSHGVSHYVERDLYSSIDILPVPKNDYEKSQSLAILDFLVKYGVTANSLHTLTRINQWTNHSYYDQLKLSDRFEQLIEEGRIPESRIRFLNQVREAQSNYYSMLDAVTAKQVSCSSKYVGELPPLSGIKQQSMTDWLSSLPKTIELTDDKIFALTLAIDTQKAAEVGDAKSVMALLKKYGSLGGAHPELDQVIFISLLNHHANIEQLIQMANYTPLPDLTIFMLISHQRVEDIAKLKPYGLKLDVKDQHGLSALKFAGEIGISFDKMMILTETLAN